MRIHTRLALGFVIALAAPLAAVYAAYAYAAQSLRAQELERLDAIASAQIHRIEVQVQSNLTRMDRLASTPALHEAVGAFVVSRTPEAQARVEQVLDGLVAGNVEVVDARLILPDGVMVPAPGTRNDRLAPSADLVQRALVQPSIGSPRANGTDELLITMGAPIWLHGERVATLVATEKATHVLSVLRDYSGLRETGETLLVEPLMDDRALVISPSRFDAGASRTRIVTLQPGHASTLALEQRKNEVVTARDYRGRVVFAAAGHIEPVDWGLVTKIDVDEALAPVHRLEAILFTVLAGSLVLALVLAFLLARSLSNGIGSLTRAARAIRSGAIGVRAEVRSHDEVGELAETFNGMADDLMAASQELESKVRLRTEELTRANEALEREVAVRTDAERALSAARDDLEVRVRERTAQLAESEAQLRQAQKMEALGRLAGGVAHDFNNLLTVILGYADAMMRKLDPESALRSYVDELRVAGERAARLTRQLLAFSRQQVIEPTALDLNAVVAEMDSLLRRVIGENIQLVTSTSREPMPVFADAGQIEQILLNLAVNSRDAMPGGGTLTIEVGPGPLLQDVSTIRLAVTDTGIGMDEATRAQAVEPFFTTKDESKGTGLGLAMVYGAVRQAGGDLCIRSVPGQGTTVELFWPRSGEALPRRLTPSSGVLRRRGSETILLVEDEPAVMRLVQEILEGAGYDVLPAHDGRRALQVAHEHEGSIDLLLTDVVMPGMGGAALAQQLATERPGLPTIFMSGYTRSEVVKERVAQHHADFLAKPVRAGALLEKVDHVLGRARAVEGEQGLEEARDRPRSGGG